MRPLLRIVLLWRAQFGWLAAGLLCSLASVGVGLALLVVAAGELAGPGATRDGAVLVGGVAAAVAVRGLGLSRVVLRYGERLLTHAATFRALADLRVWLFRRVVARSAGGLGFLQAGDVLSRLVGDIDALDGVYLRILLPLAAGLLLMPAVTLLVGAGDPGLALVIAGLFGVTILLLPAFAAARTLRAGASLATAGASLRIAVLDTLSGLREVRAFGAEGRMLAMMQAKEAALFRAQRSLAADASRASALAFLCGQAALLAVLLLSDGGAAVLLPTVFLTAAAFEVVGGLPRAGALAGHAAAASGRVLQVADEQVPVPDPARPAPVPAGFGLTFEAVTFAWQAGRPDVLTSMTLDVPAGQRVAILGPSGAGKSTLAALALKVAAPGAGRVLLGGVDIATLRSEDVRARIAWLGQATHLLDDTVRENLRLGRPDADDAACWLALDQAALGDTVRGFPDGLDTWVGEGGARLSGGQGRRLALARVLLSSAPILILDEPTAGLDGTTEQAFLGTLNEVAAGRTVILIAHRLTGVERLDRIWRLSGGVALAAAA